MSVEESISEVQAPIRQIPLLPSDRVIVKMMISIRGDLEFTWVPNRAGGLVFLPLKYYGYTTEIVPISISKALVMF
jgi:hypothetical protein